MTSYHSKHESLKRVFSWVIVLLLMVGSLQLVDNNANYYQASLLNTPQSKPFDGTVPPIEKVPNWVALTQEESKQNYKKLTKLINLPTYDASMLATSTEKLKWGNSADDKIRNAKITFATPYMGSYKLDGIENAGSHLAVDIKTAVDTPVQAIMNGVVVKAASQSTGFGKHVVIKHTNVPSLDNPKAKETLYSSYSHLNSIAISEGDIVNKGDIIGYAGETGTATTPHLHFQIDTSSAPWHPFWPFTWKEAQDAGLDFFSAVNEGLGAEQARANTIHPMLYVQKYVNNAGVPTTKPEKVTETPETTTPDAPQSNVSSEFQIKYTTQSEYSLDDGKITVVVKLLDGQGASYVKNWPDYIKFTLMNNGSTVTPQLLESADFTSGKAKLQITDLAAGETQIIGEYGTKKFYSQVFKISESVKPVEIVSASGDGEGDASGVAKSGFFTDVDEDNEHYLAIKYLYNEKVISGYADGTFQPDKKVTRVEALKFITEALLDKKQKVYNPGTLPFKDTELGVWYTSYVATAQANGLINGYPDQTFRPAQDVNLAEFAKIALNAIDAKLPANVTEDPFNDVAHDAWYAPFISYAKSKNFLDTDRSKVYPGDAMTRGDVSEFIFRIMITREVGAQKFHTKLLGDVPGLTF